CDFLRLSVMERLDQPRGWHGLRVGAEEARRVGPNLEPPRLELAGEISARAVRAAAAEQDGLALRVACDETLRQHDPFDGREPILERTVGCEVAARGEKARALGLVADSLALEERACVEPLDVEADRAQVRGAELGSGELARREHARVHAR